MPTGPRKIILIHSGRYEYAEVDINGALQIVGPNNTGKTTLINTLQFLYLDDRRHMDFGSYTPEQTKEFYFPNQYSYLLFECLGAQGACVIGWRGQSRTSGGEPERFYHIGPYSESDFLNEKGQIREPHDVNARLALKQFRVLKSAQEHRELLQVPTNSETRGLGVVALRDPDKYHQFRETLKCLLTLSAITQEQMRDRLLMLADIPPDRTALDVRSLFGEDYDRIRQRREQLVRFKNNQSLVERLVAKYNEREIARGDLVYLWSDLRGKRSTFEKTHESGLEALRTEVQTQGDKLKVVDAELEDRRRDLMTFSEQKGGLQSQLDALAVQDAEFGTFVEDLERAAVVNLKNSARQLETQLANAEGEQREKAKQKLAHYSELVKQKEQTIERFDHLAVTVLRKHFSDAELNAAFRLLSPALLETHVGAGGIEVRREQELLATLRHLVKAAETGVYQDANVSVPLRVHTLPLAGLDDVEAAREQLKDYSQTLQHWQRIFNAIEQREKLHADLKTRLGEIEKAERRLYRFEEYQKIKANEPRIKAELRTLENSLESVRTRVEALDKQRRAADRAEQEASDAIRRQEEQYNVRMNQFAACVFPEFSAPARAVADAPSDFEAAIAFYLRRQEQQNRLAEETTRLMAEVERWFGEQFRGADDAETIHLLKDELEAVADREEALARDWNAHIHGLKATFGRVLKELGEIHGAKDNLNRHFAKVPVSNLTSVRMEVIEQSDLVSWIRRLSTFEPGGLFDNDPERESALVNFRTKLQDNPVVRFADLFTLGVTVQGPDGRKHTYHDFRQIESHGTTVAIKVLYNLLLLKNQMKRDDCQVPFFLDEIQILDPANRKAILETARKLGFLAITAAPEPVSEVDSLYFLQPRRGWIVLKTQHRLAVKNLAAEPAPEAVAG